MKYLELTCLLGGSMLFWSVALVVLLRMYHSLVAVFCFYNKVMYYVYLSHFHYIFQSSQYIYLGIFVTLFQKVTLMIQAKMMMPHMPHPSCSPCV
jgi:hypothetical protein